MQIPVVHVCFSLTVACVLFLTNSNEVYQNDSTSWQKVLFMNRNRTVRANFLIIVVKCYSFVSQVDVSQNMLLPGENRLRMTIAMQTRYTPTPENEKKNNTTWTKGESPVQPVTLPHFTLTLHPETLKSSFWSTEYWTPPTAGSLTTSRSVTVRSCTNGAWRTRGQRCSNLSPALQSHTKA